MRSTPSISRIPASSACNPATISDDFRLTIRAEARAIARCRELTFRRASSVRRRLGNSAHSQKSSRTSTARKISRTVSTVMSRMLACSHAAFLPDALTEPRRGVEITMDAAKSRTLAVERNSANQSSRVRETNFPDRDANRSGFRRRIAHSARRNLLAVLLGNRAKNAAAATERLHAGDQPLFHRKPQQVGIGLQLKLFHDLVLVKSHGSRGHVQHIGHFF